MKRNKSDKDAFSVLQREIKELQQRVDFLANSRTLTVPIREDIPDEIVPGELFVTSDGRMRWSRDTTMVMDVVAGMIIPVVINFPNLGAHSGDQAVVDLTGTMWQGHVVTGDWVTLFNRPGVVGGSRAVHFYTDPTVATSDEITLHGFNSDTVSVTIGSATFRFLVMRPGAAVD